MFTLNGFFPERLEVQPAYWMDVVLTLSLQNSSLQGIEIVSMKGQSYLMRRTLILF